MKYLLILLFLFSTQSFSGEIDGKGLECTLIRMIENDLDKDLPEEYKPKQVWPAMFWFNNGLVAQVEGGANIDYPKRKKLKKSDNKSLEYNTTDTNIYWCAVCDRGAFSVNRKDLSIVYMSKLLNYKTGQLSDWQQEIVGMCTIFEDFKKVKIRHAEMEKEWEEYKEESKRKKEEEKRKAREGNKI